ncbi:tetratricopeptide repeat protein [Cryomorpha ignava]|uniref:Tetratricopeptide repeat protein n=1 Tax=Cryomorpha ignava TaxID=101383 RepID=A0A7K3WVF8_9FLAO|nr:tetratricopeptide repeat protein [Cryomorpha ignava]NEN25640.1 tetratricopeptide repeat protein [Cryomorpha ignava]
MKKLIIILILTLPGMLAQAQKAKLLTDRGNSALNEGNLDAAREAYTKALKIDPNFEEAQFNLGNSYLLESRKILEGVATAPDEAAKKAIYEEAQKASKQAAAEFEKAAKEIKDPTKVNKVQYNLGNAQLMSGEVDKGINAYKEALRKDPTDEDARYNLAYAQHMKKQQQQQQQQDQQQDQDKKDDQKQDEKKENQDQKKDEQKDQEKQEQKKDELSKEDAEKMLEALAKQEKDLQDKLNKKKVKAQPIKIEKNW